jgi:glutathione S-transferase
MSDSTSGERQPLLPADQAEQYASSWEKIQASFVDQPRESVEQADKLVADLMQRLAAEFSEVRERLESQWDRGDDVSTEDLRVALTRYRSYFNRLLST